MNKKFANVVFQIAIDKEFQYEIPVHRVKSSSLIKQALNTHFCYFLPFCLFLFFAFPVFANNFYTCTRVVDGDTIVVKGIGKVRLIGVDTPETVHPRKPVEYFGKEASNFTKRMVEGKKVRLEYDWQRKDRYGRVLAYVYLEDGTFLNAELIKQGYGHAYTKYPFKYLEQFREYEKEARENKRGLWK